MSHVPGLNVFFGPMPAGSASPVQKESAHVIAANAGAEQFVDSTRRLRFGRKGAGHRGFHGCTIGLACNGFATAEAMRHAPAELRRRTLSACVKAFGSWAIPWAAHPCCRERCRAVVSAPVDRSRERSDPAHRPAFVLRERILSGRRDHARAQNGDAWRVLGAASYRGIPRKKVGVTSATTRSRRGSFDRCSYFRGR